MFIIRSEFTFYYRKWGMKGHPFFSLCTTTDLKLHSIAEKWGIGPGPFLCYFYISIYTVISIVYSLIFVLTQMLLLLNCQKTIMMCFLQEYCDLWTVILSFSDGNQFAFKVFSLSSHSTDIFWFIRPCASRFKHALSTYCIFYLSLLMLYHLLSGSEGLQAWDMCLEITLRLRLSQFSLHF